MSGHNPQWPDRIWLAGDAHAKRRSHPREEGAMQYVRADAYDELLQWCHVMIVEGEACPCTIPEPIADKESTPAARSGGEEK